MKIKTSIIIYVANNIVSGFLYKEYNNMPNSLNSNRKVNQF